MDKQQYLPSLTLYRRGCHAYDGKYLVYLSSTTELILLEFSANTKITNTIKIKIPLEPVKQISLLVYQDTVYIAVTFITKFIVYTPKQQFANNQLALDRNITLFDNGYVAVCNLQDGFAFLRRKGDLHLFSISNRHTITIPTNDNESFYSSIAYSSSQFYLGSQTGKVKTVKLEDNNKQYKQLLNFDTTSILPILNIIPSPKFKQILVSTVEGELFILSQEDNVFSSIALHRGMISRMMVVGNRLYSVGEDQVLNKMEMTGNRRFKLVQSTQSDRLVSMLVTINGQPYMSFYENPVLKPL